MIVSVSRWEYRKKTLLMTSEKWNRIYLACMWNTVITRYRYLFSMITIVFAISYLQFQYISAYWRVHCFLCDGSRKPNNLVCLSTGSQSYNCNHVDQMFHIQICLYFRTAMQHRYCISLPVASKPKLVNTRCIEIWVNKLNRL